MPIEGGYGYSLEPRRKWPYFRKIRRKANKRRRKMQAASRKRNR